MIDVTTEHSLRVSTNGTVGPYIRVPLSQVEALTELPASRGIHFEVAELAISLDGAPSMIVVNFGRRRDAIAVQQIIDSAR